MTQLIIAEHVALTALYVCGAACCVVVAVLCVLAFRAERRELREGDGGR